MLNTKNYAEVREEIEALRAVQYYVPQYTVFGDDNWASIGVQIDALVDDWDEDNIDEVYDGGDITDHERDAAFDVIAWRDGNYEEWEAEDGTLVDSPSLDWAQLAK